LLHGFATLLKLLDMKILFVLTSHGELGNTGHKTGFWIEEFAAPYYVFKDAGVGVTIASPKGGQPPIDPKSDAPDAQTKDTIRFKNDAELQQQLANTKKLSEVKADEYDAVFFPGGHGPLWDLATDQHSIALIEAFLAAQKPVAAVCHAPSVLLHAKGANGEPLVKGKRVTGFTNSEEEAVKLKDVVPFLLEDELKAKGGIYSKKEDWAAYVLTDGLLVTGQNPASSEEAAHRLLELMQKK
jgi:putative intracellular protease/amidase